MQFLTQRKKIQKKKRENCISSIEITRSEFCTIAKKQVSLTKASLTKKTSEILKKIPLKNKLKQTSLIESIAKKSAIYNRR